MGKLRLGPVADQYWGTPQKRLQVLIAHPRPWAMLSATLSHLLTNGEATRQRACKKEDGVRPILLTSLFKKVNLKTLVGVLAIHLAPALQGRQFGIGHSEGCYLLAIMSQLDAGTS
eukprot:4179157-Amphidinium_carterae.3